MSTGAHPWTHTCSNFKNHYQNDLPHGANMSFPWVSKSSLSQPEIRQAPGSILSLKSIRQILATFLQQRLGRNQCMGTTMLHRHPKRKTCYSNLQFLRWHVSVSNINKIHDIFHGFFKTSRSNKSACPGSFNESIIIGDLAVLYMCITNAKRHYVYKNLHYLRMWYMQITIHLYIYIYTRIYI